MTSALIRKEWRQFRLLRWIGLGFGALFPVGGATALALGTAWTAADLLGEMVLVVFATGLWPLIALLTSVQAFGGDRAAGTESFLLERPVPRGCLWRARLIACGGSTAVVMAGSLIVWFAGVAAAGVPVAAWSDTFAWAVPLGTLLVVAGLLGGMLAASFLAAPLAAVLLGILLGGLPIGLGSLLLGLFPYARWEEVHVAYLAAPVLPLAYLVASFLMLARGEPAGRRRAWRGVLVLGAGVVAAAALFLACAPVLMRLGARRSAMMPETVGRGGFMVASSWRGSWLVDVGKGKVVRFLEPGYVSADWSRDGSLLAVARDAGPFGTAHPLPRIEILDTRGRRVAGPFVVTQEPHWEHLRWAGDDLLLVILYYGTEQQSDIVTLRPSSGEVRRIVTGLKHDAWGLAGPAEDGRLFLAKELPGAGWEEDADGGRRVAYGLYRVDAGNATVAPEPLLQEMGRPGGARFRLSPSGRYWIRDLPPAADGSFLVRDLESGQDVAMGRNVQQPPQPEHTIPDFGRSRAWLAGDALIWTEAEGEGSRVMLGRPGETPRLVGTVPRGRVSFGPPAPGGEWVGMGAWDEQRRRRVGSWVVEARTGRKLERAGDVEWTYWAGPSTLTVYREGGLGFVDLATPDKVLWVKKPKKGAKPAQELIFQRTTGE